MPEPTQEQMLAAVKGLKPGSPQFFTALSLARNPATASRYYVPNMFLYIYASDLPILKSTGLKFSSSVHASEAGFSVLKINFSDIASFNRASAMNIFRKNKSVSDNWWIINSDVGKVIAQSGVPCALFRAGRVFSNMAFYEPDKWGMSSVRKLTTVIPMRIEGMKIDPNTFVDPTISIPLNGAITPQQLAAAQRAAQQAGAGTPETTPAYSATEPLPPASMIPMTQGPTDIVAPLPSTNPSTPAPSSGSGATAAGLGIGALLLLMLGRK